MNWVLVHGGNGPGSPSIIWLRWPMRGYRRAEGRAHCQDDTAFTLYGKLCDASGMLLDEFLPLMKIGCAPRIPQDISLGSYFGGRRPEDGRIDWCWPAARIYDLIARSRILSRRLLQAGGWIQADDLVGYAGSGRRGAKTKPRLRRNRTELGFYPDRKRENSAPRCASPGRTDDRRRDHPLFCRQGRDDVIMKILILGVNGFIGHHLTKRILDETDWAVYGMDLSDDRLGKNLQNPRFSFHRRGYRDQPGVDRVYVRSATLSFRSLRLRRPSSTWRTRSASTTSISK